MQEPSFSVAVSEEQKHINHHLTYLFNQGLTQDEIALCLAITDNIHISEHDLKGWLARLQLYWWRNLSEPDVVIIRSGQDIPMISPRFLEIGFSPTC